MSRCNQGTETTYLIIQVFVETGQQEVFAYEPWQMCGSAPRSFGRGLCSLRHEAYASVLASLMRREDTLNPDGDLQWLPPARTHDTRPGGRLPCYT